MLTPAHPLFQEKERGNFLWYFTPPLTLFHIFDMIASINFPDHAPAGPLGQ